MSITEEATRRCEQASEPDNKRRLQGEPVKLYEPEPWPEPVNGATVLADVAEVLQRHMAMRKVDTYIVALWCAHTHVFTQFNHTPRLAITGPAAECGKTVLLSLVGKLVSKPMEADNISPAPFFRLAASQQPTFLIDEVDAWLKQDSQLVGALNNGWQKNGCVLRCEGDGNEVRAFPTHTPTALVGIQLAKKLKETTQTRCITVELERALPGEVIEQYDQRKHDKKLQVLCSQLARWTNDNVEALSSCDPELPPGVFNRRADKWRPLFAIAEIAGEVWPEWIERSLLSEENGNTNTKLMLLLQDIKSVLAQGSYEPGIFTDELINGVCEPEDSIWADYNFKRHDPEHRRIQPRQLAGLLRDFKCEPETIRRGDCRRKGYYTDKLQAPIRRYLSD